MKKLMALCLLACSFHSLAQDNKPFFQSKSYNVYLSLGNAPPRILSATRSPTMR